MIKVTVRLVYRNYKPIHKIQESLITHPPQGVTFIVPKAMRHVGGLLKVYRKFGDNTLVRKVIIIFSKIFFTSDCSVQKSSVDVIHFVNMISENIPDKPYVVDFEHPIGLANFMSDLNYMNNKVFPFLCNENCKAIICMSQAAKKTLKDIYKKRYRKISAKIKVVYPALDIEMVSKIKQSSEYIKPDQSVKLLFVGNDVYRKGLGELLDALEDINKNFGDRAIQLYIVSNKAKSLVDKHNLKNVHLFKPQFSKEEIIKYFFKPADFFIMPTKLDTFGMVYVDALAAGTPVVATNQYAIPEIVTDMVDGILLDYKGLLDNDSLPNRVKAQTADSSYLDEKLSKNIYKTLVLILSDKTSRTKLSKNISKKFKGQGMFSVERRNAQLLSIYEQSLASLSMASHKQ